MGRKKIIRPDVICACGCGEPFPHQSQMPNKIFMNQEHYGRWCKTKTDIGPAPKKDTRFRTPTEPPPSSGKHPYFL